MTLPFGLRLTVWRVIVLASQIGLVLLFPSTSYGQSCQLGHGYDNFKNYGRYRESDGKLVYTFGVGFDGAERQAVEAAVAQWNAVSDSSGIVIELAPPFTDVELYIGPGNQAGQGNCGHYDYEESAIFLTDGYDGWSSAVQTNFDGAVWTVAHEIGHFLRLNDESAYDGQTVMRQSFDLSSCGLEVNERLLSEVPFVPDGTNAAIARSCVDQFNSIHADNLYDETPDGYETEWIEDDYFPSCFWIVWIIDIVYCYDGCHEHDEAWEEYDYICI